MRNSCMLGMSIIFLLVTSQFLMTHVKIGAMNRSEDTYFFTQRVTLKNRGSENYLLSDIDKRVLSTGLFVNDSWQTVSIQPANLTYPIERFDVDMDGNGVALLRVPDSVPTQASITITVSFRISLRSREAPSLDYDRSGKLREIDPRLIKEYCGSVGVWKYDEWKYIGVIARRVQGNETNVLKVVESLIEWTGSNIFTAGSSESLDPLPLYPNETFSYENFLKGEKGRGDCDDKANFLIALCRSLGVPAYLQIGFVHGSWFGGKKEFWNGRLIYDQKELGGHGWAAVFVPPWGWLPVDMTLGYSSNRPRDAVEKAAVYTYPTVLYQIIKSGDYVYDWTVLKRRLSDAGLSIYVEESIRKQIVEKREPIWENGWLSRIAIFLIAIGTVTAVAVQWKRKLRRSVKHRSV